MMARRSVRLLLAGALLTTVAAVAPMAVAPTAGAWTDGACPSAAGVTVIIDFQELGGGIWIRCAPGTADTGFQALQQAGIPWAATVRFPGFLCRIDGKPSAAGTAMTDGSILRDACQTTSPADAYWSYWMAPRGGSWCYSNLGAGNRNPPEGTVEAWSFSYRKTASTSPAPRVAPPPWVAGAPTALNANDCNGSTPTPTAPPATTPSPTAPAGGGASGGSGGGMSSGGSGGRSGGAVVGAAPGAASDTTVTTSPQPTTDPNATDPNATDPAAADPNAAGAVPDASITTEVSGSASDASAPDTIVDADGDEVAINAGGSTGSSSPTSSPAGVVVALAIIAALTATSAVVRRRVAPDAPSA